MKKILIAGAGGTMGKTIAACANERDDCMVVAGFDKITTMNDSFPIFQNPSDFQGEADVIIDFSHPSLLDSLLAFAVERSIPAVIATTGLSEEQIQKVHNTAKQIPVFFTANMSIGVNLMIELAKKAAAVLSGQFDIEIVERHHNQKIDAPSGTALMIANAINDSLENQYNYVYDRHSVRRKRDKKEIGIHSVRGGTIVGDHEVIFAGTDEIITITHNAMSKKVFAQGAINAALYVCRQPNGLYNMQNMVEDCTE